MAKIILAGGSGNLGSALIKQFLENEEELIILSRMQSHVVHPNLKYVNWDGKNLDEWKDSLKDADVLINLCGKSINCRFTKENQKALYSSRIEPTNVLGEAIEKLQNPPKLWINFSGVSLFNGAKTIQDEYGREYGNDFLANLVKDWESIFLRANTPKTFKVILRVSPVLSKDYGMLKELYPLAKLGLAGKVGSGKQMISWIDEEDLVRLVQWIINQNHENATYHACSPNPISNEQFMKALREEAGVKIGIPLPTLFAKIGSYFKNVDSSMLLETVPVTTKLSLSKGFNFKYPYIQKSLNHLLTKST